MIEYKYSELTDIIRIKFNNTKLVNKNLIGKSMAFFASESSRKEEIPNTTLDNQLLNSIKEFDINKLNLKKSSQSENIEIYLFSCIVLLCSYQYILLEKNLIGAYKMINVWYKTTAILDLDREIFNYGIFLHSYLKKQTKIALPNESNEFDHLGLHSKTKKKPKILPITILFFDGPISRTYLEVLRIYNFRPKKILRLIKNKNLLSEKLKKTLIKIDLFDQIINKIPNKTSIKARILEKKHSKAFNAFNAELDRILPKHGVKKLKYDRKLTDYCDKVENVFIDSFHSLDLENCIATDNSKFILFTGGGIVPEKLTTFNKIIHAHPGYLPLIRGSDCIFWSKILFANFSCSVFLMDKGIDTGDIIFKTSFPSLARINYLEHLGNDTYDFIFMFLDPWIRAISLIKAINKTNLFQECKYETQKKGFDNTFYKISPEIMRDIF